MNNTCIVSSSWGSSKRMMHCCVGISHIRLCSDLNYWWKKSLTVGNTAALSSALCLAVDLGRLKPVHNVLWNSELAGCSLWGLQQFLPPTLRGNKRQLCEKKTNTKQERIKAICEKQCPTVFYSWHKITHLGNLCMIIAWKHSSYLIKCFLGISS